MLYVVIGPPTAGKSSWIAAHTQPRDIVIPGGLMATSDRERIIDTLRNLAPGHPAARIWGRRQGATPDEAQEGNVWCGDIEDIATLIAAVLAERGTVAEIMRRHGR